MQKMKTMTIIKTILKTVELYEPEFEYKKSYNLMMNYLGEFYEILENDNLYNSLIISKAK